MTGKDAQLALDAAHITTNKNTVPDETRSPFQASGIRVGTPAVTSRGMKEAEMKEIAKAIAIVAADPLTLTLLKPPGEMGADVAVGSMQRFGMPMGYGGPHAGYMAVKDSHKRLMPGRLVGVSVDAAGVLER